MLVSITISPRFYKLFKKAYIEKDTNNSEFLKNGVVARYGAVTIRMSKNVAKTGDTDNMMIRTKRAIAFVNPLTHTEAYRPEKSFADAVKGLYLFGACVVYNNEMVLLDFGMPD